MTPEKARRQQEVQANAPDSSKGPSQKEKMRMGKCEFCGAPLPTDASFCGNCGRVPAKTAQQATRISDIAPISKDDHPGFPLNENEATLIISHDQVLLEDMPTTMLPPPDSFPSDETVPTALLPSPDSAPSDETQADDEEEKRRRAALLGLGIPLLGALADQAPGHIASTPGTPHLAQIASLPNAPQIQVPGAVPGGPALPGSPLAAPNLPGSGAPGYSPGMGGGSGSSGSMGPGSGGTGGSGSTGTGSSGSTGTGTGHSGSGSGSGNTSGCLVTTAIIITTIVLILTSIITLGLTVWAPTLKLTGNATVSPGSTLSLQGSSFLPNSSVDLTLDSNIPIYYLQRTTPTQLADINRQGAASVSQLLQSLSQGKKAVAVLGNGTFAISFVVDPTWSSGQHTLHASESLTHRSASLIFTITGNTTPALGVTPTPTVTSTPSPGATPSPSPTPTPKPGVTPTPAPYLPTPTPTRRPPAPTPTPVPPTPTPTPTPLPAGTLSASPLRVTYNVSPCGTDVNGTDHCTITLFDSANSQGLSWSWSTDVPASTGTVSVSPDGGFIDSGGSETVTISLSFLPCNSVYHVTFFGPVNSVTVSYQTCFLG